MRASSKKRILRMVLLDAAGFCLVSYLVCAQVFHFFPWKPVQIEIPAPEEMTVSAAPTPASTDATAVEETPAPSDEPQTPPDTGAPQGHAALTPEPDATPEPGATPAPTAEPTPTPAPELTGLLGNRFAEKFSAGEVVSTAREYRSAKVAIEVLSKTGYVCSKCGRTAQEPGTCSACGTTIGSRKSDTVTYTVADIYIRDINAIRTAYSTNASNTQRVKAMCLANNGLLAVNTDLFINAYGNSHGWFIRNGLEIKRFGKISSDLCILYEDGTMETIDTKTRSYDVNDIAAKRPWQIWYFGPELLENGNPKTKFNSTLGKQNPRTVIGYYEPGHYCFIVVDGRNGERGLTFEELSLLCADMGLTAAYNLDGGASSGMYFNGSSFGQNGRDTSDIVYICEP